MFPGNEVIRFVTSSLYVKAQDSSLAVHHATWKQILSTQSVLETQPGVIAQDSTSGVGPPLGVFCLCYQLVCEFLNSSGLSPFFLAT